MPKPFSWIAVVQWVALTFVGLLFAGGFHFPGDYGTTFWSQVRLDPLPILGFIFGAVSGLFIAGAQAVVLHAHGGPVRRWLLWNALAFGLIHAVADGLPYRPLVILGGGPVLALCQFFALRRWLTRPLWWLPGVAVAWWLGFGLTQGASGYNLLVVALLLGGATGLGLRWLLIPQPGRPLLPTRAGRAWAQLTGRQRVALVAGVVLGVALFLFVFAALSGLTGELFS